MYGIGECLELWHLQPSCYITSLIQGASDFLSSTSLICQFLSIQTWALQEAKNRMEARGEKYKYEPSSSSSSS